MTTARAARWERRPTERVPELLEAALHVFAEQGYRRTRLDDVAERAGVTKGTIYHYFDTKEELLLAVIEHYQAIAFGRIEEALQDRALSESERLRLVMQRTFLSGDRGSRPLLTLLIRAAATEVPRVHDRWLRNGPVRLSSLLAGIVSRGQRSGEFGKTVDAELAARTVVAGVLLQLVWRQHAKAVPAVAIDDEALIEGATEMMLAALRP